LVSAEAGWRFDPSDHLSFDAALYYHVLNKQFTRTIFPLDTLLYPDAINEYNIAWAYVNDKDSKAELAGIQFNTGFKNIISPLKMNIDIFLSLARGREILPYGLGELDDYRQMPVFLGQLNISFYPFDRLYLNLRNVVSSKSAKRFFPLSPADMETLGLPTYVSGYYTMDVIARLKINRNFDVFAQMYNVFNAKYGGIDAYGNEADLIYNPQYERFTRVGLSFRLD
jgi:hemoglobin/transferrin/lactoferrin receptor protein